MKVFKIATYNVNSLRSRLHIVLPWLMSNKPDVLCMQETKVEDREFPAAAFNDAGYQVIFRGEKKYNGVAIASLASPEKIFTGFQDGGPLDEDRLIGGIFGGMNVVNTYVPQGRDRESQHFIYKLEWFRRFRRFLETRFTPGVPLVWCGDLNVAPEAIDVHNPKRLLGHVCFNPDVWKAFEEVKHWGLVDVFRKHHPGKTDEYTFFDYRVPRSVERRLGWRVDHILATKSLAKQSTGCSIDMVPRLADKPSDHTIVIAEFHLKSLNVKR
ncbi:MAG: exodeoxyribonuclease III [Syntrophales bacterium]